MTFWHGKIMNDWANRWVSYWTDGATDFVTSGMEDTGISVLYYLNKIGHVDLEIVRLRGAAISQCSHPGYRHRKFIEENSGFAGMFTSLENIYITGSIVVDEII